MKSNFFQGTFYARDLMQSDFEMQLADTPKRKFTVAELWVIQKNYKRRATRNITTTIFNPLNY